MSTLTTLGIFHTVISVLAIPVGLYALLRDGKIEPRNWVGKFYVGLMLVASFTAFGISRSGHFGPGHVLTVVTLGLFFLGFLAGYLNWVGRAAPYVETFSYSASYFFLMFFATTETLTRLPAEHPFAAGPDDPALVPLRLALLVTFLVGFTYQAFETWSEKRLALMPTQQTIPMSGQRVSTVSRK